MLNRIQGRPLPAALVILIAAAACGLGARERIDGITTLPSDQVRFVLRPWSNEFEVEPERRQGQDLVSIKLLPSGEISVHLPGYVHGYVWCHVTAPGYEPGFMCGELETVKKELAKSDLKLRALPSADVGVITGVTYHDMTGRGVIHPVREVQGKTTVTFTDEKGQKESCRSDPQGRYQILLPRGRYRVSTAYPPHEGAEREDKREYHELGWIEVRPGETRIQDLTLSTLYVD